MWLNRFGKKPFKMQSPVFRSTGTTGPPMTGKDGYEVCVLCGGVTAEHYETPISRRQHYIEGGSQLCEKCYREIYISPSRQRSG